MESISKNKLTDEQIRTIVGAAFCGREAAEIAEMNAGLCNALYLVTLDDGTKTVLKVSSPGMHGKASNEAWLMETETAAMKIAEQDERIRVPKILFYDDTMTRCSGKYFFMEYAEGMLMRDYIKEHPDSRAALSRQMGEAVRLIGGIKNSTFGIVNSGIEFDCLHGVVYQLISNVIGDIVRSGEDHDFPAEKILRKLREDKPYFDEVTEPSLVHFDVWSNNIIVKDDRIIALLDWERAVWGEPLMEDRFRDYGMDPDFLEGFGQTEFSHSEKRRLIWYNVWINLAFMNERFTRGYMTEEQYLRTREHMLKHFYSLD